MCVHVGCTTFSFVASRRFNGAVLWGGGNLRFGAASTSIGTGSSRSCFTSGGRAFHFLVRLKFLCNSRCAEFRALPDFNPLKPPPSPLFARDRHFGSRRRSIFPVLVHRLPVPFAIVQNYLVARLDVSLCNQVEATAEVRLPGLWVYNDPLFLGSHAEPRILWRISNPFIVRLGGIGKVANVPVVAISIQLKPFSQLEVYHVSWITIDGLGGVIQPTSVGAYQRSSRNVNFGKQASASVRNPRRLRADIVRMNRLLHRANVASKGSLPESSQASTATRRWRRLRL